MSTDLPFSKKYSLLFRVRYAETDQMGIAHHSRYLEWFEIGRVQLLDEVGIPYREIEKRNIRFAVTEINVKYRKPAYFDDQLVVIVKLLQIKSRLIAFEYQIKRVITDEILATGSSFHTPIDINGKTTSLPSDLVAILQSI